MLPTDGTVHVEGLGDEVEPIDPKTLECTVDPIKPRASVYWSIDGQPQTDTQTVPTDHTNGTFKLVGTLPDYEFPKTTYKVTVSCLITEENEPNKAIFTKHYRDVDVWCKFAQFLY